MAQARAPRLTQEECEQFLDDIRNGRQRDSRHRAGELWIAYTAYCRRIAYTQTVGMPFLRAPNKVKVRLPWDVREELSQGEWVHDVAQDAMASFRKRCLTGKFACQDAQLTTVLYDHVAEAIIKTARDDKRLRAYLGAEVTGHDMSEFAAGVDPLHSPAASAPPPTDPDESTTSDIGRWVPPPEGAEGGEEPLSTATDNPSKNIQHRARVESESANEGPLADHDEATLGDGSGTIPAPHMPHERAETILAEVAILQSREQIWRCMEGLTQRQRRVIAMVELEEQSLTYAADDMGISVESVRGLRERGMARLTDCLWRWVLLDRAPSLGPLVPVLDPSIGIHYVRGLAEQDYGPRCQAGGQRAIDTAESELPHLIERLLADRRDCGLDNGSLADLALLLSPAQQRVLVLALWSTEAVVIDPEADRVRLKPSADGRGYLTPDELPPV